MKALSFIKRFSIVLMIYGSGPSLLAETTLSKDRDPHISFSFTKKPLTTLLEAYAPSDKHVVFPQKAADLELLKNQLITYIPHVQSTTKNRAWGLIQTFLGLSGFSLVSHGNQLRVIREQSIEGGATHREPLPIFVGTIPESADDSPIVYIQYFRSLQVPSDSERLDHPFPLSRMIHELLSPVGQFMFDPRSNTVIMIDRASHIQAAAKLLSEFDQRGVTEEVAFVPLRYLHAQEVVTMFESLKIASEGVHERTFIRSDAQSDAFTYFDQDTRMVADPARNGIYLMGRKAHIDKIIEFITELFDKPQETGSSILHAFPLQYLDNKKLAPLLTKIVAPPAAQSQATQDTRPFFDGVAIAPEEGVTPKPSYDTEKVIIEQKGYPEIENLENNLVEGGNRIIIAARNKDWLALHYLLTEIDVPQDQVLLEILIVEFTYDHRTRVAGSIRSKTDSVLPQGVEILASHITPVSSVLGPTPTQLAEDLLQVVGPGSVASQVEPGSLLLSVKDTQTPGVFGLLELLEKVLSAKINAYPYITIKNHEEGILDSTETRRTTGDNTLSFDGSFTIPIEDVAASITIHAKPHIISDKEVRLTIGFTVDDFIAPSSFTRQTKDLRTTATIRSGEILAMGGLMRFDVNENARYTPILGRIPLVGAFFKGFSAKTVQRNITLFVMPTILKTGKQKHTKTSGYIESSREMLDSTLPPSQPRDPIFRIFFKDRSATNDLDTFLADSTYKDVQQPQLLQPLSHKKHISPVRPFDGHKLKRLLARQKSFTGA